MAHRVEQMDIDSEFDNKENSLHHSNVLPFTEKGYEEVDVSELNVKLRYSVTPVSSPMSKSYTGHCPDNRKLETGDDPLDIAANGNTFLTRSLNSTITLNDNLLKPSKASPLQIISTDQFVDSNRSSILRPLESNTIPGNNGNINITITNPIDADENLSLPSSASSALQTPEATTPTKDVPPKDGGSPIMRGLKSVLNMFRSSQSPIPPAENDSLVAPPIYNPDESTVYTPELKSQPVLASTPVPVNHRKEMSPTKRVSPLKDSSVVFNQDLEKELTWKDETTIFFSEERIPVHKLFPQQLQFNKVLLQTETVVPQHDNQGLDSGTEYMDISYNDSLRDTTMTDVEIHCKKPDNTSTDSDNEFVDCETTFTKSEPQVVEDNTLVVEYQDLDLSEFVHNENNGGSKLRPIILNTTQDILDATLSIRPEDLLPESTNVMKDTSAQDHYKVVTNDTIDRKEKYQHIDHINNDTKPLTFQDDVNYTKTTEIIPIAVSENSFNIITSGGKLDSHIENVRESILEETLGVNEDITLTNENISLHSKTFDVQITSDLSQVFKSHEESNNVLPEFVDVDESAVSPNEKSSEEVNDSISKLEDFEVTVVKDTTLSQLPVDIPLPDEDDVEKDSITDNVTENSAPTTFDLVGDNDTLIGTTTSTTGTSKSTEEIENNAENEVDKLLQEENVIEKLVQKENEVKLVLENCIPQSMEVNNQAILFNNVTEIQNFEKVDTKDTTHVIEQLTQNEYIHPVNIKQNIESLSDTVHELITVPNTENISTEIQDIESSITTNQLEVKPINRSDKQILVTKIEEQNNLTVASTVDTIATVKPLNDDSTVGNIHNKVTIHEIIKEDHNISTKVTENTLLEPVTLNVDNVDIEEVDEEFIISENNSPFVLVDNIAENLSINMDNLSNVNTSIIKSKELVTPPSSPPIRSKGYNFHFDENSNTGNPVTSTENLNSALVKDKVDDTQQNSLPVNSKENKFNSEPDYVPANLEIQNVVDNSILENELPITSSNSPPITSKGYNFNFDDKDCDPFTTKSNIRMSPTLNMTPYKVDALKTETKNVDKYLQKKDLSRRKSQPDKRKTTTQKRKFNTTVDETTNEDTRKSVGNLQSIPVTDIQLDLPATFCLSPKNVTIDEKDIKVDDTSNILQNTVIISSEIADDKSQIVNEEKNHLSAEFSNEVNDSDSNINLNDHKITSSSEQSTYFSAGTSSSDSVGISRNVFNLPEIDDRNFNPFATKCKMRQSPPPCFNLNNSVPTEGIVGSSPDSSTVLLKDQEENFGVSEDKIETELMEKDTSINLSNTTASSKTTDERNITTREMHTEDEDTVEGPFLDANDVDLGDECRETSDFLGENCDMMQFNELPSRNNEENIDSKEMFIDAEAFEFLLNQNKFNTVVDSGKESLFLKFDPLFAQKMSSITADSVVASLAKIQKQSISTKEIQSPPQHSSAATAGSSRLNITQDIDMNISKDFNDDPNITVSKPMMVVPPAVNPVSPKNIPLTPSQSNRRSITLTSPAMAVIDRLLSLSFNNSPAQNTTTHVSREQNEADAALSQLRELLAEKEIGVFNLRSESKELRNRLSTLESHLKTLERENQQKLKKINLLNESLIEKTKINKNMATVVEEYERTIASLIAETAQDKKKHEEERIKLINERDEQTAHLSSMEVSFSDLHSKYEKSKQVILHCKANEDILKKSIKDFEENLAKMQNNYELLKQHATSKLNHANQELEKMNKSHEAEVLKFNAMIKRKDLHITSLEESLIQKTKANEELTAICDDLINRVG